MSDPAPRSRRARDLEPFEEALAERFTGLVRHPAPPALRRAVFDGVGAACESGTAARGGWLLRHVPLGAWGLASAALLLLALGTAVFVEWNAPIPTHGSNDASIRNLTIVEDSRLALFHAVETFDDVGLARGHVIADWGR